jgi:adenylate cyclase
MVDLTALHKDINEEVAIILASDFNIEVTETDYVPHSDDGAITFPNLDQKFQGTKVIETTVLYVDVRRSTALSMKHRSHTVARLYSAFVRAMTRCAAIYGGEVRGIIGDRVLMLFDAANCFGNAINTAILINSVCTYVLNKHFTHNEVTSGIGIDYGNMLATKTGMRRHGSAQQSYRALVWLGRPANVASKLTDNANKPEEAIELEKVNVAYNYFGSLTYVEEWPSDFVTHFTHYPSRGLMIHSNPAFHSFTTLKKRYVTRPATPAILMTKVVYDGSRRDRPESVEIKNGWFKKIDITIPDYSGEVYGGGVIFTAFNS